MELQKLLADVNAAIKEYKAAGEALRGSILGEGFIVRCGAVCLAFDIDSAGVVTNPRNAPPHMATRFTRAAATRIAAQVKNGNGEAGAIIHVRNAIDEALIGQVELRELIESRLAASFEMAQA